MSNSATEQRSGPSEGAARSAGWVWLVALLLIALAGLGVGAQLTQIHYLSHTDPSYHAVCAVNEEVNCETVAQSPYSVFAGLPVSVWGMLAYGALLVLAVWGLTRRRLHRAWPAGLLLLAAVVAVAAAAVLAYISYVRIDSLCIFCMILYGLALLLLIDGVLLLRSARIGPLRALALDLKGLFTRPLVLVACLLVAGGAVAALQLLIVPYWHHPGWTDLPTLPRGEDASGYHWIGAENPLLTLVEFSDYECPYCRRAHKHARSMAADHADEVRLIHRQLPLDQACNKSVKRKFHEHACEFARAAECAGEQGRFWEMNDALFSIQDSVKADEVDVERLAVQLGLDRSAFNDCLESRGVRKRIERDMAAAAKLHVTATPTFFIHRQAYPGGLPAGILERALDQARAKAQGRSTGKPVPRAAQPVEDSPAPTH